MRGKVFGETGFANTVWRADISYEVGREATADGPYSNTVTEVLHELVGQRSECGVGLDLDQAVTRLAAPFGYEWRFSSAAGDTVDRQ